MMVQGEYASRVEKNRHCYDAWTDRGPLVYSVGVETEYEGYRITAVWLHVVWGSHPIAGSLTAASGGSPVICNPARTVNKGNSPWQLISWSVPTSIPIEADSD